MYLKAIHQGIITFFKSMGIKGLNAVVQFHERTAERV
jgi:hypothetical protein